MLYDVSLVLYYHFQHIGAMVYKYLNYGMLTELFMVL